jgi:hypothetical protein
VGLTLTASGATTATAGATLHGMALKNQDSISDQSGITVALAGTSRMAMTDADGRYQISGVPPGIYQLVAQAEGYHSAQVGPLTVNTGQSLEAPGLLLDPKRDWPVILATTPQDGANNVMIQREIPVTIRFSKKMVPESLRQAVRIQPSVAFRVYAGRDQADLDFDLMRIVLYGTGEQPPATFDTRYTITISTDAHDFEGLGLQKPFEMALRTGEPAVIGTNPENGGVLSDLTPGRPVVIYFNAAMDHASLTPECLRIRPSQVVTPAITARDDPVTGWTTLYATISWMPDTKYDITVQRRARTTGKNPVSNTPFAFSFRTARWIPIGPLLPGSIPIRVP